MAGKTFPGIGELEDESPPLDPADASDSDNSQSHYSGPTVVDEAKVEQGLKKLRSLDAPLTGIRQAIAEVLDDPSRATPQIPVPPAPLMPEITIDPARGTAVGRSVSGPVAGQQTTQPFDDRALRGTMFGHGVHLPDLAEARRAMLLETSKALAVVERGVPTTNEITVFQPGTYPQREELPLEDAPPPAPRPARFYPEDTPIELRTVLPRKKLIIRVAAAGACIVAIVVAALLWVRSTDEAYLGSRSTPPIPAPQPARPLEARPVVEPPPTPPAPPPAASAPAPVPPAPEARAPEARAPARKAGAAPNDDDSGNAAAPAEAKPARRPHAVSTHSDRRHSPSSEGAEKLNEGAKPDKAEAPSRPSRGKRPTVEDPDGTMAPTIE